MKMDNRSWRRRQEAFTLVELLVVVAIIGILMGLVTVALTQVRNSAKRTQRKSEVQTLRAAVWAYRHEYGDWPGVPPSVPNPVSTFSNNNYVVIRCLKEDNGDDNPRGIQFLNVDDYRWGNASNVYTGRHPAVDYSETPYVIRISLTNDTVTVN